MTKKGLILQVNILPFILVYLATATSNVAAKSKQNEVSIEVLDRQIERSRKDRIEALEKFFDEFKSPLKANAETFVDVADKYSLDYKLLPAISCMESSCGKKLIEGSYNPFGWGIYGNNAIYFKSYDEAIETVAKGIKENYLEKGLDTPEKIAPIYTPPNYINWRNGVTFFINKIDSFRQAGSEVQFAS
ncbi:glucosaminidase domain-containing protein [candidate division WWE3 bacterium]|uniref:Glucosaminidase domain-containing protein n=1 Tax=candidate division WWE3 bacterium TaxID=2053526 RepID=A0A7X9E717_UNCKA|nr:glucosaminidase domain-containing protein [candidate division WWE3 bacterium]